jgi:hypothetical protein
MRYGQVTFKVPLSRRKESNETEYQIEPRLRSLNLKLLRWIDAMESALPEPAREPVLRNVRYEHRVIRCLILVSDEPPLTRMRQAALVAIGALYSASGACVSLLRKLHFAQSATASIVLCVSGRKGNIV